jgi:hypothetical protein
VVEQESPFLSTRPRRSTHEPNQTAQVLPWDSDADVQISESSIYYLASYYNMTVFYFKYPKIPKGRYFQLEVNPNYVWRDQADCLNAVDARWIDMESGLFIDITAARYNLTHPAGPGMLSCKDGHEYRVRTCWVVEHGPQ